MFKSPLTSVFKRFNHQSSTLARLTSLFIVNKISRFYIQSYDESIVFQTYLDICAVGTVFCRPGLIQAVDRFIRTNFDEFVTTAAFYELPLSDFSNYLKHRNLKTETEETVLSAVVRWCRHNKLWNDFSGVQFQACIYLSTNQFAIIFRDFLQK